MRFILLAAALALLGCGRAAPVPKASPPSADPVASRRDEEAQAAYSLEAAISSIADARTGTKRLAPIAGGEAKEVLLDVEDMLDSAGATLAEHDEGPPPLAEYRKVASERSAERQKTVNDALDALHELRDAQGTLNDLAQNAPAERKAPLREVQAQTDEAIASVESAVTRLGGKVPPEERE